MYVTVVYVLLGPFLMAAISKRVFLHVDIYFI
jgi:hypothetical protein